MLWTYCHLNKGFVSPLNINSCSWPLALGLVFAIIVSTTNTITFVEDNGTKMVTSSDDKKVLVWEWDIGVPIKYISDPTMHSMPLITMHPSEKYLVCQSLDNKILV